MAGQEHLKDLRPLEDQPKGILSEITDHKILEEKEEIVTKEILEEKKRK